ncbi:amp-dependent synthetase ligase [Cordyceps javanica]|uniref:Amp-dependent synthetase ligase n=1 Tax=Cordyceps javanica TaxID=43265 RepID=A0A545V675_9HYPO|nr:amp-dependent synthetase ligase [Cordyceps javanica]TQW08454.1 amp-dependent synthetase ligase [Cordyceps javanica]
MPQPLEGHPHILRELIQFVRQNSQFYRELYRDVPEDASALEHLPVINHTSFWSSNTSSLAANNVVTGSLLDGGIFRTGGTTSEPKVSFYSHDELHRVTRQLGDCLVRAGLQPGDRVANLYYNGELYMGFLIQVLAWLDSNVPYVQLPISGVVDVEATVWPLREFRATVAMAMPTTLIRIAEYLVSRGEQLPDVHLLVFSGEGLYKDQEALIAQGFPNAVVRPLMYGSVDGGLIAFPTHDADLERRAEGPVYVPNAPNVIVEIIRDDGERITTAGASGLVHVTDLTRRLMPVIRYPTGDVAEWVDFAQQQFVLRGRDVVGFKIGPASYDFRHLRGIVLDVVGAEKLQGFQAVARRKDGKDELVFRIASTVADRLRAAEALDQAMRIKTTQYASGLEARYINPLAIEWVEVKDLIQNPRTGKLRETVDQRFA